MYFYKLNKYSKIFPFKYLCISEYNKNNNQSYIYLNLDEERKEIYFTINYSFNFIKIVIEKIIKESIPKNILEINYISNSSFTNALVNFLEEIIENN